ncbi:MAG: helix-hairpin-helix domain-containing protein [Bacillota bacterium]
MVVDRKQQVVIIIIAAVVLFAAGHRVSVWYGDKKQNLADESIVVPASQSNVGREIAVHVSGAVKNPGVYKFSGQMRVMDAVEKAVPLSGADIQGLNLARPLKDGERIEVPSKDDGSGERTEAPTKDGGNRAVKVASSGAKAVRSASPASVNINRASAKELESLPGIGPELAERVINYRTNKGFFASVEELKKVSGIGAKKYEKIKDLVTVN